MTVSSKLTYDPWEVREEGIPSAEQIPVHETLFTVGNGYVGIRGHFEESGAAELPTVDSSHNLAASDSFGAHKNSTGIRTRGGKPLRATYINGIYDQTEHATHNSPFSCGTCQLECFVTPVPEMVGVDLYIGSEMFSLFSGKIHSHQRIFDLKTAQLRRIIEWTSPSGKAVKIETLRFVSDAKPNVVVCKYVVTPMNFASQEVRIVSGIGFHQHHNSRFSLTRMDIDDDYTKSISVLQARTRNSRMDVIAVTHSSCCVENAVCSEVTSPCSAGQFQDAFLASSTVLPSSKEDAAGITTSFTTTLREGHVLSFCKIGLYITENDESFEDVMELTKEKLAAIVSVGYETLLEEHKKSIAAFWAESDVIVNCEWKDVQGTLRHNLLHLYMSAGRTSNTAFALKGLTGELFGGMFCWEQEVFIFPFFVHNFLPIAKNILQFRINTLRRAEERAMELDLPRGALYPSRTINGGENSPSLPCSLQLHTNADIAHAFKLYYEVTNDIELMKEGGAAVVIATSLVWLDWGTWDKGQFHLRNVTGPDDYNVNVNDNYYTNLMAQSHLRFACVLARLMHGMEEWEQLVLDLGVQPNDFALMMEAADKMCLPYDPHKRIHLQDEAFLRRKEWKGSLQVSSGVLVEEFHPVTIYRHKICKSADVILCQMILGSSFTYDEKAANFAFYEKLTAHDWSMTNAAFSVIASELGRHQTAYDYFEQCLYVDSKNLIGNSGAGIHAPAMAGSWSSIAMGFGGMRTTDGVLHFNPYLPQGWEDYSFTVKHQGATIQVSVGRRAVTYQVMDGPKVRLMHANSTRVHLTRGKSVSIKLHRDIRSFDFDAVIFDMSSIIQHVEEDHYHAWKAALEDFFQQHEGSNFKELSEEQYLAYIRNHPFLAGKRYTGLQKLLAQRGYNLPHGDSNDPPSHTTLHALANIKHQKFREIIAQRGIQVIPGALELINDLRHNGVSIGCVSSSKNGSWVIKQTRAISLIDCYIDGVTGEELKLEWRPELHYFDYCAKKLDTTPSRTVLIMDAVSGFSQNALTQYCLVGCTNSAGHSSEDLQASGVGLVVKELGSLSTELIDFAIDSDQKIQPGHQRTGSSHMMMAHSTLSDSNLVSVIRGPNGGSAMPLGTSPNANPRTLST